VLKRFRHTVTAITVPIFIIFKHIKEVLATGTLLDKNKKSES
jgi:hypothetical protein